MTFTQCPMSSTFWAGRTNKNCARRHNVMNEEITNHRLNNVTIRWKHPNSSTHTTRALTQTHTRARKVENLLRLLNSLANVQHYIDINGIHSPLIPAQVLLRLKLIFQVNRLGSDANWEYMLSTPNSFTLPSNSWKVGKRQVPVKILELTFHEWL